MKRIHFFFPILLQSLIYIVSLVLFKIFCRIRFEGVENLLAVHESQRALGKGLIFAANHSSEWDGILLRVGLPFFWSGSPMYYVSMRREFYTDSGWRKYLYGGVIFNLLGAYPTYSGHRDYAYSLQNFTNILKRGRSVCIFPEGQRTKTGELGKAHGGVAFLAHSTGTTVIPVTITGLVGLKVKDLLLFRKKVTIAFGAPILPSDLITAEIPMVDDYKAGAEKVMATVARGFAIL